jgi:hypothetical protein
MSLTPGQLAKLRREIARQADYLHRLTERIEAQAFPSRDPVRVKAVKAREAVYELLRSIPVRPLRNAR